VIFSYLINKLGMNFDAPSPWGIYFQDSATPLPKWSGKSLMGIKLPNSGKALKPMVLSYIWKYISGWINYSGIVISRMISENLMGNRGSKSVIRGRKLYITVKEQRVDGSCTNNLVLRCTLMGFERNYQNKILTTQLVKKKNKLFHIMC